MRAPAGVTLAEVVDRRIVVWGAGLEAQGVVRRLEALGARVVLVAVDDVGKRADTLDAVREMGVDVVVGEAATRALTSDAFVIASPSIPPRNPHWSRLVEWDTTTNMWLAEHSDRAVAITGSKGKSTTTAVLGAIVSAVRDRVEVGGNIGVPFFDLDPEASTYVLEVGSPQTLRLTHSPRGGAITTLYPEHLDFHGSLDDYYAAKWNLFAHGSEFVVAGGTTLTACPPSLGTGTAVLPVPSESCRFVDDGRALIDGIEVALDLPQALATSHSRDNVLIALTVARRIGVDIADPAVAQAIAAFQGLPHRLRLVSRAGGVDWIDDSLSTIPQSAAAALSAYAGRRAHLIVGGHDRGVDYTSLRDAIAAHGDVRLVTIPESGPTIASVVAEALTAPARHASSIAEAVEIASAEARPGDVVLFSPAAPSGLAHVDYRARSAEYVAALPTG